jgi:hypothetical protein
VRTSGHQQFSHKGPVKTKFCLFVFVLWGFDLSFCRQLITEVIAPFWLILVATVGRPHNTQAAQAVCLDSLSLSLSLSPSSAKPKLLQSSSSFLLTMRHSHNIIRVPQLSQLRAKHYLLHTCALYLRPQYSPSPLLCSALLCKRRFAPPPPAQFFFFSSSSSSSSSVQNRRTRAFVRNHSGVCCREWGKAGSREALKKCTTVTTTSCVS